MIRRIKLTPAQAARIATDELGRRIPAGTVRQWKFRHLVAGGNGWVDGEDLLRLLAEVAARPATTRKLPRCPSGPGARR